MALATLDGIPFRINPSAIQWNFSINTAVEDTVGGRVVQVIGANLSDITVSGEYGEKKGFKNDASHKGMELRGPGLLSWELAEDFIKRVRGMMEKQSADSRKHGRLMHPPLDFTFPEYGWHFGVYIKAIDDGQGQQAIRHSPGTFAYKYRLTLFIVQDRSANLHQVTNSSGKDIIETKRAEAIKGYISRISHGIGWKNSQYNDPRHIESAITGIDAEGTVSRPTSSTVDSAGNTVSIDDAILGGRGGV